MNDRKTMILFSVINSYIRQGEPIGSKHLAEEYSLDFSPATIRNEMSTLEKMGFLEKAHTSSGRLPSDRGYRFYVDYILAHNLNELDEEKEESFETAFKKSIETSTNLIETATKLLARFTDLTAISILLKNNSKKILDIELVKLSSRLILLIAVFDNASIVDNRIYLDYDVDDVKLRLVNEALRKAYVGKDLDKNSKKLSLSKDPLIEENRDLVCKIEDKLRASLIQESQGDLVIEGLSNIFKFKESEDKEKAKDFIEFFEDKENLKDFFQNKEGPLNISIGGENEDENLKNKTVITSSFKYKPDIEGQIGIIGLTRINYKEVIGYINMITDLLNNN